MYVWMYIARCMDVHPSNVNVTETSQRTGGRGLQLVLHRRELGDQLRGQVLVLLV